MSPGGLRWKLQSEHEMGAGSAQSIQRVLFVDDDAAILQALARVLRSLRHPLVTSGAEALARMSEAPFDVVMFSDTQMRDDAFAAAVCG
jgi:CheY-like chemotaxis protein